MPGASFNYFFRVDVTVAGYFGGAKSTKTYSFVNKPLKDSTAVATYWPILRSVGEVSIAAGETLPTFTASSVEIDNRVGSFGVGRKFSDILQPGYYSPVEQTLVVYVGQVANDTDTVSSWTQLASLVVNDWEAPAQGETLVFNVRSLKFDEKVLTLEVATTVSGMELAPESSLGRAVPLPIGSVEVVPVRISADGAVTVKYAVGTCFYQHLKVSALGVWGKGPDDTWLQIQQAGLHPDYSAIAASGSYSLNTYDGRAFELNISNPSIVCGIRLMAKGNGVALRVSSAYLDVFIMQVDPVTFNVVNESVAKGTVALSYYDASNNAGTASFAINVSFDAPFVPDTASYNYYFGWKVRNYGGAQELSLNYNTGSGSVYQMRQDDSDANTGGGAWLLAGSIAERPLHKLLEATYAFSDHVSAYTQAGLTYSTLTLTQPSPDTGQENPNFDQFAVVVSNAQLQTYAGATLTSPVELAEYLSYTWNTSTNAWEASQTWDSTTLNASHYANLYDTNLGTYRARGVRAVFDTKVTFSQVIAELARGTASRVGVYATGKAFMYPWGVTASPAFDIPFADATALTWQQRDVSTIVNRCVLNMGKKYTSPPRGFENPEDANAGYVYSSDFSAANYPQVAGMTQESRALYGNKDLANANFLAYPSFTSSGYYLGGSQTAGSILAEYYFARFAKPLVYCSFIVPWHRYSAVKQFDVVTFSTPAFPAFYGTDPDASPGVVDTGSSVVVTSPNSGYDMVRAQTYRGLVEGISYVLAMEHAPAIRLTVLVLTNQPYDPT